MNKFIKLFWFISLLGFLAILLLVYSALPLEVDVSLGSTFIGDISVSRNIFFYTMIAIVVLSNGLFLALSKAINLINADDIKRNVFLENSTFRASLTNWLGSFSAILNLFYSMGTMFVGLHNNPEYVLTSTYSSVAYLSIFLIIGWIFWLVVIVLRKVKIHNG